MGTMRTSAAGIERAEGGSGTAVVYCGAAHTAVGHCAGCRRSEHDASCITTPCCTRTQAYSCGAHRRGTRLARGSRSLKDAMGSTAHRAAALGLFVLCVLVLPESSVGQTTLTAAELQEIRLTHCRNGTLSMTAVCNTTWLAYPTGCLSDEVSHSCVGPVRGKRCRELPDVNMTCLSPILCGALEVPPNSALEVSKVEALQTVKVVCNAGYEYNSRLGGDKVSRGFSGEVYCLESGNYSEIQPTDFSCEPVECGIFCRYCADEASTRALTSEYKGVSFDEWGYQDRFGPCCLARSDPSFDFQQANRLASRLGALSTMLAPGSPSAAVFPDSLQLECTSASLGNVPGSGYIGPSCIPRPGCVFNPTSQTWSPPACQFVRGMYQPGMTCAAPAMPPFFAQYETPTGLVTCQGSSPECEFPISVGVRLATLEPDPSAEIVWTYAAESPVTPPTELVESAPKGGASTWVPGQDITIASVKDGCNVVNQFKRITAISIVPGKPNSPPITSPFLKVTATSGRMPNATRMPVCPDVAGQPKTESNVHYWCSSPPNIPKSQCSAANWQPAPPLQVSSCPAYRYFVFEPVALAASETDAYSLSELRFFYKANEVTPEAVSTFGKHPAAEATRYVTDGSLDTKVLQMDRCSLEFDFGREVAIDAYQLGTSNDCNSRDPLRWKMFASNDRNKWVEVLDQTKISYSMPVARSVATPRIPITSLQAKSVPAAFRFIKVTQSTNVVDALNTLAISFNINYKESCAGGQVCFKRDNAGRLIDEPAPLGTIIHIGGFMDTRTPQSNTFPVHSILSCSTTGDQCEPVVSAARNRWTHVAVGGQQNKSKLDFILLRCLTSPIATISFQTMNPLRPHVGQLVLQMRGEGTAEIDTKELEESDSSSGVTWGDGAGLGHVLKASGTAALLNATVHETTAEASKNNSLLVEMHFNFPPMAGTELQLAGLNASRTLSSDDFPVHFLFEDGTEHRTSGRWDGRPPGTLMVTQGQDARFRQYLDGTMSSGHSLRLRFSLVNRAEAQPPQHITVSVTGCSRPRTIGGCVDAKHAGDSGGYHQMAPVTTAQGVLTSHKACTGQFDACRQCHLPLTMDCAGMERVGRCADVHDDVDSLCLGCDGTPNSGLAFDACGVCGGLARCIGCDGVKDSGTVLDACGVCGGSNECEIDTGPINITWPHIMATLEIAGSPDSSTLKASSSLRFSLRLALAATFLLPSVSVDIMGYTDVAARRGLSRQAWSSRSLFFLPGFNPQPHTDEDTTSAPPPPASASAARDSSREGEGEGARLRSLFAPSSGGGGTSSRSVGHGWGRSTGVSLSSSLVEVVQAAVAAAGAWGGGGSFDRLITSLRKTRRVGAAAARAAAAVVFGGRVRRVVVEEEREEGVCDARKACWSGCKVNSAPVSAEPLSSHEIQQVDVCRDCYYS